VRPVQDIGGGAGRGRYHGGRCAQDRRRGGRGPCARAVPARRAATAPAAAGPDRGYARPLADRCVRVARTARLHCVRAQQAQRRVPARRDGGIDMADAANASLMRRAFDRARLERLADWLAVAVVVSLPWSTSATGILVVVWLVALIPTLDVAGLSRELRSAAGGLPVLLWVLAALGMLWADVTFAERIFGLGGFHKLLIIPLLLLQFRRSERGHLVLYGFLISCVVLQVASWILYGLWLADPTWVIIPNKLRGIPVKDYIAQSSAFLICALALLAAAIDRARAGQRAAAAGLALLAALFLANIFYVAIGRTALVA